MNPRRLAPACVTLALILTPAATIAAGLSMLPDDARHHIEVDRFAVCAKSASLGDGFETICSAAEGSAETTRR